MTFPGTFWSVPYCGHFWIVLSRLLWPAGLDVWRVPRSLGRDGWALLLLHRCDRRVVLLLCAWTRSSGRSALQRQCCDLFEHQDTLFSALGLLPVHTVISDSASGFGDPLEHVAAAASSFNFQPDLPATSAAKAADYMKESAAASSAEFLLDGQTDLLAAPAANALHFL